MLPKPPPETAIEVTTGRYNIGIGTIYAKALRGPHNRESGSPRQALMIHGEGMGINHTLLERPARWLIARDLFDLVILPDRRGAGNSSPVTHRMNLAEQAEDMKRLLDRMGIHEPVTALGVSYAGSIVLALASIDPRISRVVLVAASPARRPIGKLESFLARRGLLGRWLRVQLRRSLGKRTPQELNFDPGYDSRNPRVMSNLFADALKYLPADRAESLEHEYTAVHDPALNSLPPDFTLDVPILQVIGEGDEVWETGPSEDWQRRFPNLRRKVVPGALIHNDLFLMPNAYYTTLFEALAESGPAGGA